MRPAGVGSAPARGFRHLLLAALLGVTAPAGCAWLGGDEPVRYTVVRGDTLGEIATAHGVTVDDLRTWNGLEGDLIEVGQVLVIHTGDEPDAGDAPATSPPPARRTASRRPARPGAAPATEAGAGWSMPTPKDCLEGPEASALGDEGMVASSGLSRGGIRTAVDAFLPRVVDCVTGPVPQGPLQLRLTVGCDGVVRDVGVASDPGWPDAVRDCVIDRFRYAPFPAHDLPDGDTFVIPVRFGG